MKRENYLRALFLGLIFFCGSFVWAEENDLENIRRESPFSKMYLGLEAGEIYPFGNVEDAVDVSPYGQIEFRYFYFGRFDGFVQFGYSYLETISSQVTFPGVHQFHGRVGLLWLIPQTSIHLGGGFSCIWARSDGGDEKTPYGGTLNDNESEFGWNARLRLPIFRFESWNIGLNAYWEQIWTKPERTNMLWFGVFFERRIRG